MTDYLNAGMRLGLEKLVDWEGLLTLRRGEAVDLETELGAIRAVLDTAASLAASFERPARKHWSADAKLTPDGGAQPPSHIRKAYGALRDAGLVALPVSEEYGGAGLPVIVNAMLLEMVSRADTSLMTVIGLQTGVAGDIERYGSDEVKRTWLPRFTSGEVQGCMDLTEPQAGSDLGGIVTKATDLPDGAVRIDGRKIFITNGGAEVHLVLARDADGYEGSKGTTKGLSLVLVPRHLPDGSPNGVRVARLEKKIGIHGSPTCEVELDGARGVRLGAKGQGFRAMLDLMNNARLGVAAQALGLAEAALSEALRYAREREQFGQPIAEQPLVKTMLAKMAVNLEAVRALLYHAFEVLDFTLAAESALAAKRAGPAERDALAQRLERETTRIRLLTPLCKYFATEVCDDVTRDAMQVLGGVGYTLDAAAAKLHADSLIMTVYEGTSEIQASFALREMGKGALVGVFEDARDTLRAIHQRPELAALAERVEQGIGQIEDSTKQLFGDFRYALLRAKLVAEMVIDVLAAVQLLRQAVVDPARGDVAAAWIRRRMLAVDESARRIGENHAGRLERDARVLSVVAKEDGY